MQTFKVVLNQQVHRFKLKEVTPEAIVENILSLIDNHHSEGPISLDQLYNPIYKNSVRTEFDEFPEHYTKIIFVRCPQCGKITTLEINYNDYGRDDSGDNLDSSCPECNFYWKKAGRITEQEKLFSIYIN